MSVVTRGVRNAFRNQVRTLSIVLILSLSIGLALSMLLAHQAVNQKIKSVKSSVGNTISISPAGVRGFEGGGTPLTQAQINKVKALPHVASVNATLSDRLTSDKTSLQSSIDPGNLGRRFASNSGASGGQQISGGANAPDLTNFTMPVTVTGTDNPTNLASTQGGGTFSLKSGQVFSTGSSENVALLGTALATKNNLSVGSTFTAYGATIKVVGIFDSGNTFSNSILVMPLTTVQTLSAQTGDVTSATVTVDDVSNVSSATTSISSALGSAADVTNDQTRAQESITPLQNIQSISLYSLIGSVIAGAVIILLTMIMIVRERRREIGVIKAIGASNIKVIFQFMSEAVTFTLLAAVIGIAIGIAAGNPITNMLVNNSTSSSSNSGPTTVSLSGRGGANGLPGGGAGFRAARNGFGGGVRNTISNLHTNVGWDIILYGLGAAIAIAVLGSAVASWFIAKVRPAEVMRTE